MADDPLAGTPGHCESGNDYDGKIGLRVSAIFVILVGSMFGAWFPVYVGRRAGVDGRLRPFFFFAKYFGSGVIIATSFIHLLAPAHEALTDPCLIGPITEYTWVEGIVLMTVFVLFIIEFVAMRQGEKVEKANTLAATRLKERKLASTGEPHKGDSLTHIDRQGSNHIPHEDHLGHSREHAENSSGGDSESGLGAHATTLAESYAAQLVAVGVLEFGVIFHSIFIGLTLAVSGSEFNTLYVVLVFHQTFEGLGLGSRLSMVTWPASRRWTPYLLAIGYALSTPIAIAVGLGVRKSYPPGSQTALIVNGVCDSISAGILIYTGLVELMAHEFMFSPAMKNASAREVSLAFTCMILGAGLMALLGKWA